MDAYYKKYGKKEHQSSFFQKYLYKFLVLVCFTLIVLIGLKKNLKFKTLFYEKVYNDHFSFAKVNKAYKDMFGSPIPFEDFLKPTTSPVFNEKLTFKVASKYYDGVNLEVSENLLVPVLESGMVVFIGEKENYGNTVIIEQIDGTDVWYGNVMNINLKLYDYVEKGSVLGNTKGNNLYLVFKKDGKTLDYTKYIN